MMLTSSANSVVINNNNDAVAELLVGNYPNALRKWKETIEIVKDLLADNTTKNNMRVPEGDWEDIYEWTIIPPTLRDLSCSHTTTDGSEFLIQQVVILRPLPAPEKADYFCGLIGALLYNIATINHLLGTRQGSTSRIQQAGGLYNMAHCLTQDCQPGTCSQALMIVLLNNKGQLHDELGQYEEARATFTELSVELPKVIQTDLSLTIAECGLLAMNIYMSSRSQDTAAGAA